MCNTFNFKVNISRSLEDIKENICELCDDKSIIFCLNVRNVGIINKKRSIN